VSAIKVDGERAYAIVRGGDVVKLAARPFSIFRLDATSEQQLVQRMQRDMMHALDSRIIMLTASRKSLYL
jgi:tRNA pseudouridine55 synthase